MLQGRSLIVEDEPDLRQVFVDILTSEGFDTSTAIDLKNKIFCGTEKLLIPSEDGLT